jgi:hypothetical protein
MIRYVAAAALSKAFSATSATRGLYRLLGNQLLGRMRTGKPLPERYVHRAQTLLDVVDRHGILRPGDHVLELGTGWVHWEGTILGLFHDVQVTMYDVCDNRLFGAYRHYLRGLRDAGLARLSVAPDRKARARQLIGAVLRASSFEEAYALLGSTYLMDPTGLLRGPREGRYRLIVSCDVLEHVPRDTMPGYLRTARRLLRAGGWSYHQIDLADHFSYYDPTVSPKNYYRYSDTVWRRCFDSDVQYINRLQRPDWLALFGGAGFRVVEETLASEPIGDIALAEPYRALDPTDRDCLQMRVLHRRDPAALPAGPTGSAGSADPGRRAGDSG